jgi:hypothetical protein
MQYEDQLYSHPGYYNGALAAIEIYTRIHDKPELTEEKLSTLPFAEAEPSWPVAAEEEAERKRAAKKAQKAEQKAKKAAAAASDGKKEDPPAPDDDPDGTKLLKTATPLDDAMKLWEPLEKLAGKRIQTWLSGYEIYIRKGEWNNACERGSWWQACTWPLFDAWTSRLLSIVTLPSYIVKLSTLTQLVSCFSSTMSVCWPSVVSKVEVDSTTRSVIEKAFTLIPANTTPADFSNQFLSSNSTSAPHILAVAAAYELVAKDKVESTLYKLFESNVSASVDDLTAAIEILHRSGATEEQVSEFRIKCRERLPLAWVFASKEEKSSRQLGEEGDMMAVNGEKADV